jgi:hypothetical protein
MNQEWSAQGQVALALRAVIADFGLQVEAATRASGVGEPPPGRWTAQRPAPA